MGRRSKGDRVHGPYPVGRRWRVVHVAATGKRTDRFFESRERADRFVAVLRDELVQAAQATLSHAFTAYERHLIAKGNKVKSYKETVRRLKVFFPPKMHDLSLDLLTAKTAAACYQRLVDEEYSVDTHRNMLAEAKSFLRWCAAPAQRWLPANVLEGVEGQGRRHHGKPQLRIDEARLWMKTALELADAGKEGALAALVTLLLGMRCSEVVSRQVRDVDDGGRLLWIPDSKTNAGRRTLEVPEGLRARLAKLADAEHRKGDELLFGKHDRKWPTTWVADICTLAKVPRVTGHGMRGLHSTLAVDAGMTGHLVAASLGHESFATTATSYAKSEAVEGAKQRKTWKVLDGGKR